jgi:quercetin dioxygenase-like cupin family protein
MIVRKLSELEDQGRVVQYGPPGYLSHRFLTQADGVGFTVTKTLVPAGEAQEWHYPNHLESCYCVHGRGTLTCVPTGETWEVGPDTLYALDGHEEHTFQAHEDVTLICVFSPALRGDEAHRNGAGYPAPDEDHQELNPYWRSPVYSVRAVPMEKVTANDYNPNRVAPPEMQLLETSVWEDGYTQPIVVVYDPDQDQYIVVDGFHRYLTMKNSDRIRDREGGMLPVVVLDKDPSDRMASTIRHNRARGTHHIDLMSQIVAELVEMGKSDRWICKHIGMSPDELLRMKQITGIAALFQNEDFSQAWEAEADDWD